MTPLSGILEGGRSNVPLQNHHRSAATIDIGETARSRGMRYRLVGGGLRPWLSSSGRLRTVQSL